MSCLCSTCNLDRHGNSLPSAHPYYSPTVLASRQNWPRTSLQRLAFLSEKQHGPNDSPGLAAVTRRKGQMLCQQSLKGMKSAQRRKRVQLQPALAVCMWSRCQLAVTSTGPADRDIKTKVWPCPLLPKHPLPPVLPVAALCRPACITPAGIHVLILCLNSPQCSHSPALCVLFSHTILVSSSLQLLLSLFPSDHAGPVLQLNIAAVQLIRQRQAQRTVKGWPPY